MPLRYFNCCDGVTRPVSECLNRCERKEGRCLSLPTLHTIGYQRPFTKPSVTQCLNPTRIEYLKLKYDFAVDPVDRAFALLGTNVHHHLDNVAKTIKGLLSEQTVMDDETVGTLDLLEPDGQNEGQFILIDNKTWGSYACAKILGRKQDDGSLQKAELQLNGYRLKVESTGLKVSRMGIQAIVRDGGTFTAKNNLVPERMLLIPINRLDDCMVRDYFSVKSESLLMALCHDELPPICEYEERWANRRCLEFCEVSAFCPEGAKMAKIQYKGKDIK